MESWRIKWFDISWLRSVYGYKTNAIWELRMLQSMLFDRLEDALTRPKEAK